MDAGEFVMRKAVIVVVFAAALSACGTQHTGTSPSTTAPAGSHDYRLGDRIGFARTDNGGQIGAVAISEAVTVPAECSLDPVPPGGQLIGVHMEIVNDGPLMLPEPTLEIQVNDAHGFMQKAAMPRIASRCQQEYTELPTSIAPGKTQGWILIQPQQPDPAAVIYAPLVGTADSTIDNIKLVAVQPQHATVALPHLQPAAPLPAAPIITTTSVAPEPTAQAPAIAAPVVGAACDPTEGKRGTTAGGQSVECALAGASSPHWVRTAPIVGTRTVGSPCPAGKPGLAISPDDQDLVCVGNPGSWQPGP